MSQTKKFALIPVMFCFFAMGFVDLVGIASNYVKEDLQLTDSVANIFPSLVFFWFLIFPLLMGFASDAMGQAGAVIVMTVGVIYLFTYINRVK